MDKIGEALMVDRATLTLLAIWLPLMAVVLAINLWRPERRDRSGSPDPTARTRATGPDVGTREGAAARFGKTMLAMLLRSGITANQITLIGLVLVVLNCALYLWHRDAVLLGMGLVLSYVFDTLDGLVARARNASTRFGGYLDAIVDRIQETATLCVIGIVTGLWLPAFLVITGSMMTSYNKARVAIEIPVENKGWPDFFDKTARQFFLCFALLASDALPFALAAGLWVLAGASYLTAAQRIARAWFLISAHETAEGAATALANPPPHSSGSTPAHGQDAEGPRA